MTIDTAAPPAPTSSSRVTPALAAAATLAAAASLYAPVIAGIGRQWLEDPNAAYGALVAAAAAVALWQRSARLRALPPRPSWSGAAALAAAALLCVVGTLAADVFLLRVSLVGFLAAAVWFVAGTGWVRACAVPLALLLASIPLPNALVTELTLPLQLAASQGAAWLLAGLGVDVVRDGNVLTLGYITLEVAEACSGMRSLVTLLALVAVYGGLSGSGTGALVLALAAVPVAIAGNGLRVAFTALLAGRIGERAAQGLVHDATGFAAFAVMGAALLAVYRVMPCRPAVREEAA